jgi:flagellar biosynthesis protein FlhF
MQLKLYRARGMADAMRQARAELGADALILSSRRLGDGVEITAGIDQHDELPPPLEILSDFTGPDRPEPENNLRSAAMAWHGVPPSLAARLRTGPLAFALSAALRFERLKLEESSAPLLLAGPPGAGKTLTTVRLATRLVMAVVMPLVITADDKRAGATEQLAAFTRLLGLKLLVASTPDAMARALAQRENDTPVLIDAPGGDPFDAAGMTQLRELADSARAAMALVLPAGLDPGEAADLSHAHIQVGARLLVATRLDVARRLGGVLAAAATGLALAEAGIGPGAADGLVPLTPEMLAYRLQQLPARPEPRP